MSPDKIPTFRESHGEQLRTDPYLGLYFFRINVTRPPFDAWDREVTIMGDRSLPYRLLKKIMATCTEADYGRLSLAVLQKLPGFPQHYFKAVAM